MNCTAPATWFARSSLKLPIILPVPFRLSSVANTSKPWRWWSAGHNTPRISRLISSAILDTAQQDWDNTRDRPPTNHISSCNLCGRHHPLWLTDYCFYRSAKAILPAVCLLRVRLLPSVLPSRSDWFMGG